MANFNKLMEVKGVILAGEFALDGQIIAYDGDFPLELADDLSRFCAVNRQISHFFLEKLLQTRQLNPFSLKTTVMDLGDYFFLWGDDIFLLLDKDKVTLEELLNIQLNKFHRVE